MPRRKRIPSVPSLKAGLISRWTVWGESHETLIRNRFWDVCIRLPPRQYYHENSVSASLINIYIAYFGGLVKFGIVSSCWVETGGE